MSNEFSPAVSEELFAAWLDGNLSEEEQQFVERQLMDDPEMQELLAVNEQVEEDYNELVENGFEMPEELMLDFELQPIEVIEDYEDGTDLDDAIEDYPDDTNDYEKVSIDYQDESDDMDYEDHNLSTFEEENSNEDVSMDIDAIL